MAYLPLDDPAGAARYEKAKAYVEAIYRICNKPVGRGHRHPKANLVAGSFGDVTRSEALAFWLQLRHVALGYENKPPPSQLTVNLICDLIDLIERCKR